MRRLMVLLGLLAALMLVASPVSAWQPGPNEGNKYSKNYYPDNYFKFCEPDGSRYYGNDKAGNAAWCLHSYTEYQKKRNNGEQYYYVHVVYFWQTPDGQTHKWDDWYYCQYHKYDDPDLPPDFAKPYFKAWVTYKPTGNHYWESFHILQKEG